MLATAYRDGWCFAPMREAGVEVIHTDLKPEAGVEVAGDLMDTSVQAQPPVRRPRAVLTSNLCCLPAPMGAPAMRRRGRDIDGTRRTSDCIGSA